MAIITVSVVEISPTMSGDDQALPLDLAHLRDSRHRLGHVRFQQSPPPSRSPRHRAVFFGPSFLLTFLHHPSHNTSQHTWPQPPPSDLCSLQ